MLHCPGLAAQIDVVRIRIHIMAAAFVRNSSPDHDQLLGVWKRQRSKQNGIDHAKDRAVRANAQRKSDNRYRRKRRRFSQHAEGVSQIG